MSDTIELIGTKLDATVKRDAIHIAVIPMTADRVLAPGVHVNAQGKPFPEFVGIVDPFLQDVILPGERFFVFLTPKTITSLRHVWSHPAFPDEVAPAAEKKYSEQDKAASEAWMRQFAKDMGIAYGLLVAGACEEPIPEAHAEDVRVSIQDYGGGDSYLLFQGTDAHGSIPEEFWDHLEVIKGRRITKRAKYFSCSC